MNRRDSGEIGMALNMISRGLPLIVMVACVAIPSIGWTARVGLHVTTQELEIWRDRAENGPYKTDGDVAANSPGDWTRIRRKADEFLADPAAERWSGQPSGCWLPAGSPALPGRTRGEWIRDAAFYSLVTGEARYRDAVLNVLLEQAAEPGTDFSGSRWCDTGIGDAHSHEIAAWLTKMLYAYDYIRAEISDDDRAAIDAWFDDAAVFWSSVVDATVESAFPNREADDYSAASQKAECTFGTCITHYDGWNFYNFHEVWNNRNAIQISFAGSAAIVTDNPVVKERAKRYFREWLRFAVFPDNTDSDYRRWTDSIPSLGWAYSSHMTGAMAVLADHFARAGDRELYEYSTSEGFEGLTPAGGPKSLKNVITHHYRFVNGEEKRYGTKDSSKVGNPDYLINSVDPMSGQSWVYDTFMLQTNVYFKDEFIRSIYTRTAADTPSYPEQPSTGGFHPWTGLWGTFPGVMLMFADMEGQVWPYEAAVRPRPPVLLPPTQK